MLKDRFTKIILVAIAALLAGNLVAAFTGNRFSGPSLVGTANAQSSSTNQDLNRRRREPMTYRLKQLQGFSVADIKDVVPLGDGRSFIVSNSTGFMVYQVMPDR